MIYFCIPAYNEERTVGVVLWKLRQVMAELDRDYQIIVIDDASTDSTPAVLSPYIRVLPLTVIRNQQRRGFADSMELALREAVRRSPYPKRDAVIALQADFTEDPDVVPAMIKRIEAGADIVATNAQIESSAPRSMRWGRRFLRWLLRRHEWGSLGDPLSGLRAYRIVVLKRALDARGTARLLTWNGIAANAELLAQAAPLARRNDVIDSLVHHNRLQRDSRFSFAAAWPEVRGVKSGKPAPNARALPTDSAPVAPLPIAVETPVARRKERGEPRPRRERSPRSQGTQTRAPRREKSRNGPRPSPAPAPKLAVTAEVPPVSEAAEKSPRKRRRSRRRKTRRPQQETTALTQENPAAPESALEVSPEVAPAAEPGEAPKKKSRRGRRGGRGRRRGPRPNTAPTENQTEGPNEAPPPLAAEGD